MASLVEAAPGEEKPKRKVKYASGFFAGVGNNKPVPKEKAAADAHPDTVCGVCGAADSYSRCGRCQKVVYCGPECQEYDWWRHKKTCIPWDYKPIPAAEQSTICPYCQREVKMKDLGLHMDSDCGKYLDVMLGRKPMPPMDGPDPADDDGNDEPEVEWVPSPRTRRQSGQGGPPPRERKGKDGGPVAPPKRDRRRERFKKDLNPVQQRIVNAYREEDREITGKLRPGMEKMLKDVQELFESTQVGAVGRMAG
ncbi:hypothetical protein JL722_2159 [Aureococcus anophagefferens]|nr:hypothetical protein JL722_2159 [Aureococcus anophagefferens]